MPTPTEVLARTVLAPVLSAWANAAISALRHDPALHAVAALRDGALATQAIGRLAPELKPRLARAWLSRRLTAIAAIDGAQDHENLSNYLVRMRHRPCTWAEAADELRLPPPPADKAELPLDRMEPFWSWLETPNVRQALETRVRKTRHALLTHLDSQVDPQVPLLIVDVGYAATVQRCLKRVHHLVGRPRRIDGLYLLTSPGAHRAEDASGKIHGVLAHLGQPQAEARCLIRHRDVLECLLAPNLGELHELDSNGVPVLTPPLQDPSEQDERAGLQAAALESLDPGISPDQARQSLLRFLMAPQADEAALVGRWHHADSTALDGFRRLDDGPVHGDRDQCLWPAAARFRE
ncbi:hypothetical protein [Magnetospirillum sp. 64-120]|uniref:hypothetical protein n=1 Tax=Magnetospirillum sp. 64-120 TaxID=1895778 RepID=UPI0025B96F36|nr:hypothetical protein [Magnetospirillum sp. 64-120]